MKDHGVYLTKRGETILDTRANKVTGRPTHLLHRTAGQYPAGSRTVYKKEAYCTATMFENTSHGKSYEKYDDAMKEFLRITN